MGAASTVPVDGTKPLDIGAQPKNVFSGSVSKIQEAENKENSSSSRRPIKSGSSVEESKGGPLKRKYSLELMTQPVKFSEEVSSGRSTWPENVGNSRVEVGDVVRVAAAKGGFVEGLVIEIIGPTKIIVDCGDFNKGVHPDECELIAKVMDFEEGDKVEVKPADSQLYFVGKIIRIHPDKTLDVLMDGDDPDDIEYNVSPDNARKLMSRRALVVNRWKRAFMLVLAANFFRRIHFYPRVESKLADDPPTMEVLADEK